MDLVGPVYKYIDICKLYLDEGKVEAIDPVFQVMLSLNPELKDRFINMFSGCLLHHYLAPSLPESDRWDVVEAWRLKFPDWEKELKKAFRQGRAASVAIMIRESLILFAKKGDSDSV